MHVSSTLQSAHIILAKKREELSTIRDPGDGQKAPQYRVKNCSYPSLALQSTSKMKPFFSFCFFAFFPRSSLNPQGYDLELRCACLFIPSLFLSIVHLLIVSDFVQYEVYFQFTAGRDVSISHAPCISCTAHTWLAVTFSKCRLVSWWARSLL